MAMREDSGFHKWDYHVDIPSRPTIFPDGCRDLLIVSRAGKPDHIVLTDLDFRPRIVTLAAGTTITGFRLRPGVAVSQAVCDEIAASSEQAEAILGSLFDPSNDVYDAIHALARPGATVEAVAQDLGVSVRTMQRQFLRMALPPPEFWRLLARARRAVGLLPAARPLAYIACECGYSDQAHMTREFMRWFGTTPARLRGNADILAVLRQPALGNWIGEQISTR